MDLGCLMFATAPGLVIESHAKRLYLVGPGIACFILWKLTTFLFLVFYGNFNLSS